jgi:hypothetical protein
MTFPCLPLTACTTKILSSWSDFFKRFWLLPFRNLFPKTGTVPISELWTWEKRERGRWKENYFENLPSGGFFHTPLSQPFHRGLVWIKTLQSSFDTYFPSAPTPFTTEKWRKDPYFVVSLGINLKQIVPPKMLQSTKWDCFSSFYFTYSVSNMFSL